MIPRLKEHTRFVGYDEPRQSADPGGDGWYAGAGGFRHRIGEGLGNGAYDVYIHRGVIALHVGKPAGEEHLVRNAELLRKRPEHPHLLTVSGNDKPQLIAAFCRLGKSADRCRNILYGIETGGDAHHDGVAFKAAAYLLKPLGTADLRHGPGEIHAVIYGEKIVRVKAAGYERFTHFIGNADAVIHRVQRDLVQFSVGEVCKGSAEIVQLIVAVDGAYKGYVKGSLEHCTREICAAAMAMNDIVASGLNHLAGARKSRQEAAVKYRHRDAHSFRLAGELPLHIADKIGLYIGVGILQQRQNMGLRAARVAAGYKM